MVFRVLSTITQQVLHSCRCSSSLALRPGFAAFSRYSPNSARKSAQLSIGLLRPREMARKALSQHEPAAQNTSLQGRNAQAQRCGCVLGRKLAYITEKHGD